MKHMFFFILSLLTLTASAQDYKKSNETTYVEVIDSTKTTKKSSSIETDFIWIDKDGKSHTIWLSKNGRAFIKSVSKKSGKEYPKYLSEELSREICKKLNRTYIVNPNKL